MLRTVFEEAWKLALMRAEITFDLVMTEDMAFVESCYRLAGGVWQVFMFRRYNGTEAVGVSRTSRGGVV